jgi:hypothetical protein
MEDILEDEKKGTDHHQDDDNGKHDPHQDGLRGPLALSDGWGGPLAGPVKGVRRSIYRFHTLVIIVHGRILCCRPGGVGSWSLRSNPCRPRGTAHVALGGMMVFGPRWFVHSH